MIRTLMGIGAAALIVLPAAACRGGEDGETVRFVSSGDVAAPADTIVVYKAPTCGCCTKWVDHVAENGFAVVTHDVSEADLMTRKQALGVPAGRTSCHTATVGGYTIEGHVPADLIRKLLIEQPGAIRGLAVPGMPMGSPGMEGLYSQPYDVLSFDESGDVAIYAKR